MKNRFAHWVYARNYGKPLSPTQKTLMEMIVGGTGIKQAAAALGMECSTASTQLSRVKLKLGAKTRYEAVAIFAREKVKDEI